MDINENIIEFLELTAWRMEAPAIGSAFHIFAVVVVASVAVLAAVVVSRIGNLKPDPALDQNPDPAGDQKPDPDGGQRPDSDGGQRPDSVEHQSLRHSGDKIRIGILFTLGLLMLVGEIYKQLFYYYIVNDEAYDWWFFPFQLCSVPMYLCLLLPFLMRPGVKGHDIANGLGQAILTFMCGFTFVSAVAALAWPEDMLRPYLTLTWHGFIWHGVLLFISVMIGLSGMADLSWKGFLKSVALFLLLCAVAIVINVAAEPIAARGTLSYPNMFYLSPYHASTQPIVRLIDSTYGRPAAMLAYIAGVIALAGTVDLFFAIIAKRIKAA